MPLGDTEMAQGFLNTETEGLEKKIWRPPPAWHVLQANLRQQEAALGPSRPTGALSSRNSEIWASTYGGPHTSLHIPIRVSPGLRFKMDLLLPWPSPRVQEASLWNEALLKLAGGSTRRPETWVAVWNLPLTLCAGRNQVLSWGLGFPIYKLFPSQTHSSSVLPTSGIG